MAVFRTVIRSDLQKPLVVQQLSGNMFTADNASNEIAVEVTNGGEPVALSGAVTAYAIRADGVTAMFSGTISGNVASVVLPATCYTQVGTLSIVVKVGSTTVGACTCYVYRTTTDEIVDPGHVIPSIDELLEQIDACRTATTNANTATANANTAASNANNAAANANTKAGAADAAAQNANTKATAADTATANANTATGKINNMTVAATELPAGSAPVATITEVDGHKHIAFQIPKGDKGKDFHIAKTFASISAMMAYTGTDIEAYDFAMIDTGSVEDPDTGKLYCYEPDKNPKWSYIGDLSGAKGIKGETGTGIDHVTLNNDYTLTVYYDDGTSDTTTSIRGATGVTPQIAIGSVSTLLPGQQAYVTLDPTSTPEHPVMNFGIPKGDTGSASNIYGTTVPMSENDSTTVYDAIGEKLDKDQGASNAGKFMKVGADGALVPDTVPDPTGKADKVQNAIAGNFAGLDANGNLTDSGKKPSDFLTQHQDISGKLDKDQGSANAGKFMKVGNDGNLVPDNVPDPSNKADKVQNAIAGNFAGLDANGNITDSGKKPSDFLTQHQDISGKVDKNQGTENAGKALGINNQGQVVPVPFSGEDFTGATPASAGTHGYVPAPQITDMTKFLCGDGTWADVAGGKLVTFELDEVTGTGGAYGHITYISSVTHDMKAVLIEVSDPEVFLDEISISCMDGGIALSCNNVNGTSTVTVSCLFKANPDNMTSSEFDVLSNRIGTLGNLKTTAKSNLVGAANELYDDIAETKEDLEHTQDGLGIGADGDTHAAVSSGQFVYVRNHDTLANGLYKASAPISANGALSTSNLTPDGSGGLNALKGDIDTLNSKIENEAYDPISVSGTRIGFVNKVGRICIALFDVKNGTIPTTGVTVPSKYKADSNYSAMCRYYDGTNDQVGTLKIAYNSTTIQLFDLSNNVTTGRYLGGTLVYFTDSTTL